MILEGGSTREHVRRLTDEVVDWYLDNYCEENLEPERWNLEGLGLALKETFGLEVPPAELASLGRAEMTERFKARAHASYDEKERQVGAELMRLHERLIMLQIVDTQWKDHLYALDHLKEGIGLRGYGQRDPLVEYKKESFGMFQALMDRIDEEMLRWVYLYQPVLADERPRSDEPQEPELLAVGGGSRPRPARGAEASLARGEAPAAARPPAFGAQRPMPRNLTFNDPSEAPSAFRRAEPEAAHGGSDAAVQTVRREGPKVGRNDPCPCGSGKKYKKCHGA
jgi:preprotein translocase subunit SecA